MAVGAAAVAAAAMPPHDAPFASAHRRYPTLAEVVAELDRLLVQP